MAKIKEKIILQDEASKVLKKVANEAKQTSTTFDKLKSKMTFNDPKVSQGFKSLGGKFDGMKDKFASTFPKFSSSLGGVGDLVGSIAKINPAITAAVVGIGAYTAAMKGYFALTSEYVSAFQGQFEAETKLGQASLSRRGKGDVSDLVGVAGGIQGRGVVGDETLLPAVTKLLRAGNVAEASSMQSLIADMMVSQKGLESTSADAEAAGDAINKALNGQIKGLQQYGVYVDADTKKRFTSMSTVERSAVIMDQLSKSVGGTNEAFAKTSLGIKANFDNAFGDIKEGVGAWAVDAIGSIYSVFKKYQPIMERVGQAFGIGLNVIGHSLAALTDVVFAVGEAIWEIGAALLTPITNLFGGLGETIGLGGDMVEQFAKVIRVIGANISFFGKVIGGMASVIGDGLNNIVDIMMYGINKMFESIAELLPKSITSQFDFLSKAGERANERDMAITDRFENSKMFALGDITSAWANEVNDIMNSDLGIADQFNALLGAVKAIGKDTGDINKNTKKSADVDDEYLNNVRDYFINRNTWNTTNSQIDNRQYSIQMAGGKLGKDISGDLDNYLYE